MADAGEQFRIGVKQQQHLVVERLDSLVHRGRESAVGFVGDQPYARPAGDQVPRAIFGSVVDNNHVFALPGDRLEASSDVLFRIPSHNHNAGPCHVRAK